MKQNNHTNKYFYTKDGWIEMDLPKAKEKESDIQPTVSSTKSKDPELKTVLSWKSKENEPRAVFCKNKFKVNEGMNQYKTFRNCTEYFDNIKEKYKFNHLYRKRILKIKKEEFNTLKEDTPKITQLLESNSEIKAQYIDKSRYREVRGEGIKEELDGGRVQIDEEEEESIVLVEKSTEADEVQVQDDIVTQVKKCLESLLKVSSGDREMLESTDKSSQAMSGNTTKSQCPHFVRSDHKKLFIVPECIEADNSEVESLLESLPTHFESCVKELHAAGKVVEQVEEQIEPNSPEIKDPWGDLKRYQYEKHGYVDFDLRTNEKSEMDESSSEVEDIYKKVIKDIINKEVSVKGVKMKIKEVIGKKYAEDIIENCVAASLTLKGDGGEYLKGVDIKRMNDGEEDEREIIKQVLDSLAKEWGTIATFLFRLAQPSMVSSLKYHRDLWNLSQRGTNQILSDNIHKMVSEMLNMESSKEEGRHTHDLNVEIKFDKSNPKNLPVTSQDLTKDELTIKFREKIEENVHVHKNSKKISKTTVTKRDFSFSPSSPVSLIEEKENVTSPFKCKVLCPDDIDEEDVSSASNSQTHHRGMVQFISGGKYAGLWNYLGMEGCGIYISPGGTMIDGYMNDGVLDGPATVFLPNGMTIAGYFVQGKFISSKITFGDGIVYKNKEWDYLKNSPRKDDKSHSPILAREIPPDHYDTGEGFYNPSTKLIYHPITMAPIRSVSEREEKWILSVCRGAESKCVSLDKHLYETTDVEENWLRREREVPPPQPEEVEEPNWLQEYPNLEKIHFGHESKSQWTSPERLLKVGEKSKPIEDLWNNVRTLTGNYSAHVGLPFSYEKTVEYTCTDEMRRAAKSHISKLS